MLTPKYIFTMSKVVFLLLGQSLITMSVVICRLLCKSRLSIALIPLTVFLLPSCFRFCCCHIFASFGSGIQ